MGIYNEYIYKECWPYIKLTYTSNIYRKYREYIYKIITRNNEKIKSFLRYFQGRRKTIINILSLG